jgi:hypothetical protein
MSDLPSCNPDRAINTQTNKQLQVASELEARDTVTALTRTLLRLLNVILGRLPVGAVVDKGNLSAAQQRALQPP